MNQGQDHDNSDGHEDDLIAAAERDASEHAAAHAASLPPPGSVPGYEITRVIGRGAMGVVYEAEQEHPQRRVALKMVRDGRFVDDHDLRLFRREVQTLARLKHPHVASIYEAGHTADGQHFFAMELVHGSLLNNYVRRHRLDIRARLELFQKICGAINYAHQRGVIHRDLKPSNILIDAGGGPKILDFGLAKITDSDVAATTVTTEFGRIQGTLPYMSPEQARGDPNEIDLRSDVYALGVILFELLTDQLPYDVNRVALPEAVRVLCHEPPRKPSTINRTLRGDQETIALKALEKDPSRRYQSALALGEDVERYLTNQPILAHPPSAIYQFRKLVTRHKLVFSLAANMVLLLIVFSIWMSALYARASRAEDRVRQAANNVIETESKLAVSEKVTDLLQASVTTRETLDSASKRLDTEFTDQPPLVRAAFQDLLGNAYRDLALYDDAEPHLRAVLETRRQFRDEAPADFAAALENLAGLLADKGDYEGAKAVLYSEALAELRAQLGDEHPLAVNVLSELARLADRSGDFETAETLWREVLKLRRELLGDEDADVAEALKELGWALQAQGKSEEAEERSREALTMLRTLLGPEHLDTIAMQGDLAWLLQVQGHYTEAEPLFNDVLAIRRKLLGNEHPEVADSLSDLAKLCRDKGDFAAAEPLYREALEIRQKLWGDEHPEVVGSMNDLARLLHRKGDHAGAESLFRETLRIRRERLGDEHWEVAGTLVDLARSLRWQGEFEDAVALCREALQIRRAQFGDEHWQVARSLDDLATMLEAKGDYAEAESLFREALEVNRGLYGESHPRVAEAIGSLARLLMLTHEYDEAEALFREALAMRRELHGEEHPFVAAALTDVARLLRHTGDFATAEPLLRQALDIYQKVLGGDSLEVTYALTELGLLLMDAGNPQGAEPLLRQAVSVRRNIMDEGSWQIASAESLLGGCLTMLGQYEEAEPLLLRARPIIHDAWGAEDTRALEAVRRIVSLYDDWGKPDVAEEYRQMLPENSDSEQPPSP